MNFPLMITSLGTRQILVLRGNMKQSLQFKCYANSVLKRMRRFSFLNATQRLCLHLLSHFFRKKITIFAEKKENSCIFQYSGQNLF